MQAGGCRRLECLNRHGAEVGSRRPIIGTPEKQRVAVTQFMQGPVGYYRKMHELVKLLLVVRIVDGQ